MVFNWNTLDQEMIKDINQKKILQLLQKRREMTKQEMSQILGLSIPTISNNINELMKEGLVEEGGVADSTGGRKPVIIRFLPDARFSFGVDISTQHVHIVLTNLDSQIRHQVKFPFSRMETIEDIMKKIAERIQEIIKEQQIEGKKVVGIGFSLPGTVNEEIGNLEMAPNLGLYHISFKNRFSSFYSVPIYIENEANAAALGELHLGVAKQMQNLVYLSIKEGIGSGIVIQGHLYKGKNKRAGEFGHMSIIANGKYCNCGRKGCWELYASVQSLLSLYKKTLLEDEPYITLDYFFHQLDEKEQEAQKIWNMYLEYLATGIQDIILSLDPHYIVIGGDISLYGEHLLPSLKQKVFVPNSFYEEEDNTLVVSALQENASVLGASLLPLHNLLFYNDSVL